MGTRVSSQNLCSTGVDRERGGILGPKQNNPGVEGHEVVKHTATLLQNRSVLELRRYPEKITMSNDFLWQSTGRSVVDVAMPLRRMEGGERE